MAAWRARRRAHERPRRPSWRPPHRARRAAGPPQPRPALAARLRAGGLLRYAEPDARFARQSAFDAAQDRWARIAVVPPTSALAPPAPTVGIGIVDDAVDLSHPDVGPNTVSITPEVPVKAPHGTMVASAAAGVNNGTGVLGVLPGNRVVSFGLPDEDITCAQVTEGVGRLVRTGVKVINLSLGSPSDCFALFESIQKAYAAGTLVVAAVGNDFLEGNPVTYPAAYPHVLSVAALNQNLEPSLFSNENTAVDVAAPGERVPVATPVALDDDGTRDGLTLQDGTSFASPIVAGAAAWLFAARPGTANGQIADLLRRTAVDVSRQGYDAGSGFGLINLPRALAAPVPREDPREPNDGITFVDGTVFSRRAPAVWRGAGRKLVRATVDEIEDPVDVYRVEIPARASFSVLLHPTSGDPDLAIYDRSARTISARPVDTSTRGPGRTDTARLTNRSATRRTAYIAVTPSSEQSGVLDAGYRLELRRAPRRR
ncbi:MAG TPA: S8 family serine peptidase [Baekduia sp.]|nr:S8 family serine peptidase [Baekduia sp.]